MITEVTGSEVIIKDRSSKPSRQEISSLYQQVHKTGEVIPGSEWQWTFSVTYAILMEAVPDEIETIPGKLLGIRLRNR